MTSNTMVVDAFQSPPSVFHRRHHLPTTMVTNKKPILAPIVPHMSSSTSEASKTTTTTTAREINLYNSLSRSKDPFVPINPAKISMYTCGPTVYDYAHVGNFRAFLTYDVLKRVLTYFGYDVDHICNLTDVDDKIIKRCNEEGVSLMELTTKYTELFMNDLEALNIVKAREYPRATDHIPEMVQLIQDLEEKGLAYRSDEGSWYFRIDAKEGYGEQLVNLDFKGMKDGASNAGQVRASAAAGAADGSGASTDADEYDVEKIGARDFALWKAPKMEFDREDAIWDTDIGKGRPGWHLECSAMAKKYLGETIDLHCGGIDLKFPHHENEIAQSEGASGKKFCTCWLHNGFVNIGSKDEKMSKSKGNFLTLRTACPKNDDVRAYRYLVVSSQYRNPLSFTTAAMGAAKGALKRMDRCWALILETNLDDVNDADDDDDDNEMAHAVHKQLMNFETAIADDLSMPRAAASLFAVVKLAEGEFKRVTKAQKDDDDDAPPLDTVGIAAVKHALQKMDQVFGLFYQVPKPAKLAADADGDSHDDDDDEDQSVPEKVMELVKSRMDAKDSKDWDLADTLRSQITDLGFAVKDVKGGDPIVTRLDH
eukprot:CAMPEP_0195519280 /NCGR_PEP_ID=MMETSP0794_2-20130614/14553_1 /TAXON_ID=515487 /ORGANISM="Stephanopyxis turris, Strain CCMP 815" /LENGTH=595 /DNA_ID=CAMNT_0040648403 /DNA_START=204 /DNA_END=1991 /DNA_ORIENTATION=-